MIENFTSLEGIQRITDINAWVQRAPQKLAVETYGSFAAFEAALLARVTAANGAASAEDARQDPFVRVQLTYAAALFRDSKYALMHRGRLQELGIHNMFREAYETGRAAAISEYQNS